MKILLYLLLLILIIGVLPIVNAKDRPACVASRLTDDDARILLYVTPDAVNTRKAGTDVDILESMPSKNFPVSDYFIAQLLDQKPKRGNGNLGYYRVDKRTADVVSDIDSTEINGMELTRVQKWMRHAHCIHVEARQNGK